MHSDVDTQVYYGIVMLFLLNTVRVRKVNRMDQNITLDEKATKIKIATVHEIN